MCYSIVKFEDDGSIYFGIRDDSHKGKSDYYCSLNIHDNSTFCSDENIRTYCVGNARKTLEVFEHLISQYEKDTLDTTTPITITTISLEELKQYAEIEYQKTLGYKLKKLFRLTN